MRRNNPTIIATAQIVFPPLDFPIIERIKPKIANGIPTQLSHPNKGINPIIITINDRIPKILPIVFINVYYCFAYSFKMQFSATLVCQFELNDFYKVCLTTL